LPAVGIDGQVVSKEPTLRIPSPESRIPVLESRIPNPESRERAALGQEDIEIPIVVVVEERNAGAENLGHVELPRHAVDVHEIEARLPGAIDEPVLSRRRRRLALCAARGEQGDDRQRQRDERTHSSDECLIQRGKPGARRSPLAVDSFS
jgi:hypothetical protein